MLDDEKSTLAGKLSENCPENGCYIGIYSRFSVYSDVVEKWIDEVMVVSGPEVYAQELIRHFLEQKDRISNLTIVHSTSVQLPEGVHAFSGSWKEKDAVIRKAKYQH